MAVGEEEVDVPGPPLSPTPSEIAALTPRMPATRPPPRRTASGGFTHTPGRGANGAYTPEWLLVAWRRVFPTWDGPGGEREAAFTGQFAIGYDGSIHPARCPCNRPECPIVLGLPLGPHPTRRYVPDAAM